MNQYKSGITLLETLVAMTILLILFVLINNVVGSISPLVSLAQQRGDALSQARFALDRFSIDLANRSRLSQTQILLTKNGSPGNDEIQFYCQVPGYSGDRKLSLVDLRISPNPNDGNRPGLWRAAVGTTWNPAVNPMAIAGTIPAPQTTDFQELTPGVFRMEIYGMKKSDGTFVASPNIASDCSALIVCVAAMRPADRDQLTSAQITTLSNNLPDAVDGADCLQTWSSKISGSNFTTFFSGIPKPLKTSVHLLERTYVLP